MVKRHLDMCVGVELKREVRDVDRDFFLRTSNFDIIPNLQKLQE